ncbi:hypothetical protein B484DRAFT_452426 [Ochromonadaceae sp. CCMP2298]|nr:hypothetical protein B484DRAFT_452426 [Ochromonadaceae sp. CCMP2298]
MLRAGLRNLKSLQYLFKVETLGSLPRRMPKKLPTKFIAQSADRLSQIVDLSGKVKASSDFHDGAKGSAAAVGRLRLWGSVAVAAAPGMLKSALLGGSLFWMHDVAVAQQKRLYAYVSPPGSQGSQGEKVNTAGLSATSNTASALASASVYASAPASASASASASAPAPTVTAVGYGSILLPALLAMNGGLAAGGTHGTLYVLWDRVYSTLRAVTPKTFGALTPPSAQGSLAGTALSHSLVHGSLFGTYELLKWSSLYAIAAARALASSTEADVDSVGAGRGAWRWAGTGEVDGVWAPSERDTGSIQGLAGVLFASTAAALVAEGVGNVTLGMEEQGAVEGGRVAARLLSSGEWFRVAFPTLRPTALAALSAPTVLGFFAYEYAKDLHLSS